MRRVSIEAPSRLHFGLLAWGLEATRLYGGVGLAIREPGPQLEAQPSGRWEVEGPLATRVRSVIRRLTELDPGLPPAQVRVVRAPMEHVGLGTGTQLALATARLVTELAGRSDLPVPDLARWTGRGLRSGIGIHGFEGGGFLLDGGRNPAATDQVPPLISRICWPDTWRVMLVIPYGGLGLHGPEERQAFASLPGTPRTITERLCRITLLELLPALLETDLPAFGAALESLQEEVGRTFEKAQGGIFAHPNSAAWVRAMREAGLKGVGQSSWGPTLYGFTSSDERGRKAITEALVAEKSHDSAHIIWTQGLNRGANIRTWDD